MRIGIEAQRILRKNKHGMDVVALQLVKSLQENSNGNEIIVFVKDGPDRTVLESLKKVKVVFVSGLTYLDWEQVWLPLAIIREKIDLMHFTSNTASVFCPIPYVLTVHDVIYMENTSRSKAMYQRLGAIYRSWNVPIAIRRAARVVTVSKYESDRIIFHFPDVKNNLRVIYNAVSPDFFDDSTSSLENVPHKFFLFLGNTDPKKNTNNVIKGYVHYRQNLKGNLPLVIGDFPREQVEKLMINENAGHLLEDVISLGYLSHRQLAYLYRKATAFLYPSLRESFGIPILEAMASQCPVITSITSSMPEVAGDAAVLVDPMNSLEIGQAMSEIEKDKSLSDKLIAKGKNRSAQFSWVRSARQYLRIYEDVSTSKLLNKLLIQNL